VGVFVDVLLLVLVVFEDDVDVGCGDFLVVVDDLLFVLCEFVVIVCWFGYDVVVLGVWFVLKYGICIVVVKFDVIDYCFDVEIFVCVFVNELQFNDIGCVWLCVGVEFVVDVYVDSFFMGVFILIDELTYDIVGVGMVG